MQGTRTVNYMIRAVSDSKGLVEMSRKFQQLSKDVKSTAVNTAFLSNTMRTALGYFGVREIAQSADSFQQLSDRIKIFTGSAQEADRVFGMIVATAKYAKTSVQAVAETYNRVGLAMQDVGLKSEALLGLTLALQQSFRLSGSTIAEATGATIQLTQALASGQLRGQELRSVLEANVVIGGLLATELGVMRGQLIKFAESGKITSAVVLRALAKGFDDLNIKASDLKQTFGQSLTLAMDAFRVKIKQINEQFNINGKFATGLLFITENMRLLAVVASAAVVPALASVANAIKAVTLAMLANPWTAILTTLAMAATGIYLYWDEIVWYVKLSMGKLNLFLAEGWSGLIVGFEKSKTILSIVGTFIVDLGVTISKVATSFLSYWWDAIKGIVSLIMGPLKSAFDWFLRTFNLENKFKAGTEAANDFMASINKPAENNAIKAAKIDLDKLQASYDVWKKAQEKESESSMVEAFRNALLDAAKNMKDVQTAADGAFKAINTLWSIAGISVEKYNSAVNEIEVDKLKKEFDLGKISIDKYYESLIKVEEKFSPTSALFVGTQKYIESAGTISQNVANAITNTFNTLEDTIVDFVKTGQFEFKKFTQSVLDDLTRIIIRAAIIRPIASGIMSGLSGMGDTRVADSQADYYDPEYSAKGNIFSNSGLHKFATGGIVNRTTGFNYVGGRGVMGEAGPEAILPLKRNSRGDLGVQSDSVGGSSNVTVNVINNSGSEVTQSERTGGSGEKILDIIIEQKVQTGIATGKYDKVLGQAYGMKRRGT